MFKRRVFLTQGYWAKDLQIVRDILIQRLGTDFAKSATGNKDNYVSPRVSWLF